MIYEWKEYISNQGFISIHGFGLDEKDEPVIIRIPDFTIYIYVDLKSLKLNKYNFDNWIISNKNKQHINIIKYNIIKKHRLRKVLDEEKEYGKLYFNNINHKNHLVNYVRKIGGLVFEEDINIIDKFLCSKNLSNVGWITLKVEKIPSESKISKLDLEYITSHKYIQSLDYDKTVQPLILSMDIEVYSSNPRAMPDPTISSDKIFMISVISQKGNIESSIKKYILYISREIINATDIICLKYKDEVSLINGYFDLINIINPDIIIGYNIYSFDYKYIDIRLRRCLASMNNSSKLIKDKTESVSINWQSSAYGFNNYIILESRGRIQLDLYQFILKEYKLQQYTLSFVSKYFLKEDKEDLEIKRLFTLYEIGDAKSMIEICNYCIKDSILSLSLFNKLNMWVGLIELSKVVRTDIKDLYTRGQQLRIKSQLFKECYEADIIMDKLDITSSEFKYEGAIVADPVPGIYNWCIILDFSSLYPSVIISNNICYSTYIYNDDIHEDDCNIVKIGEKIYKFLKSPKGIIPNLLEKLLYKRDETKKKLANETDELKIIILDKRQWALKISANSVYGAYGSKNSPYLQFIPGAESTTALGRQFITQAIKYIMDNYFVNFVYGDTDSCMIYCPVLDDYDSCKKYGLKISNEISKQFPEPIKLEYEDIYKTMLIITKKRYIAYSQSKNKTIYKGVVTSRRDNCEYLRILYTKITDMIICSRQKGEIKNYVKQKLLDLYNGNVDIKELIIRKRINKKYVDTSNPLLIYMNTLKQLGTEVNPGDRVEYVFIKNITKLQGYKMWDPTKIKEYDMQIDYMYYIEVQIKNPIDQLLELIGMEKLVERFIYSIECLELLNINN